MPLILLFIQYSFNAQLVSAVNTTIFRSLRLTGCYFMGGICKKYRGIARSHKHKKHRTYLLIPRSRVLLEKLIGFQLVKKFPEFYGTRRFITLHLSLSWACAIQSILRHPISRRFNLNILPSTPVSRKTQYSMYVITFTWHWNLLH